MALTDSLVSYWKLDEASGNATDAHGSNTLTDNNTVGSGTGKISNGRVCVRANSEYFNKADNTDLSVGDIDFTFSCWVNSSAWPADASTCWILDKRDGTGAIVEYQLQRRGTGSGGPASPRFRWQVVDSSSVSGTVDDTDNVNPSNGVWYFIVCWHDSVNNVVGIQINNGTVFTTAHTTGVRDGDSNFQVSGRPGSSAGAVDYLEGTIDEVGFWKRVLTAEERSQLYAGGNGLAYPFNVGRGLLLRGMGS